MIVAGFEITETIHEDSLAGLYRARRDDRTALLKVLRPEYPTPRQLAAFRREFELLGRIDAPDVVRAVSIEPHRNGLVLVLEDVPGRPLSEHLAQRPIPLKEFLHLAVRLARVVGEIHGRQIIHRDLRPSAILHAPNQNVLKLVDFGLATDQAVEEPAAGDAREGTLAYTSPEQTGRMNRSLDHRTDFYSLGATFYEMLAGRPPFVADSALELVHAHLARAPDPLERHVPLPPVVSAIVEKLLAKNAEDRYQSTSGLIHDLETCRQQLESTYTVVSFPLGQKDRPTRFRLPQKLYGREAEARAVVTGFEEVCRGAIGVLLVSGLSGIGKSSLVHEVQKPLVRERGYFIEGKFDQLRRDRPYSALIQAFQGLAVQLLMEPSPDRWARALATALGPNLRLITDVIPEFAHLVGVTPRPADVGSKEAQNRFLLAFQDFFGVFQRREHPLVLFIDDLQWADEASLGLLRTLATDPRGRYLYIMGCYRQAEVGQEHALRRTLASIRETTPVREIELPALGDGDVRDLLVDAFRVEPAAAEDLARLVVEKTAGNPFFVREFLRTLHEAGHLGYRSATGEWAWDIRAIREMEITDNVTSLMSDRLRRLPPETREIVEVGACIGGRFRSGTLSALLGVDVETTHDRMRVAVGDGLVLVREDPRLLEETYRFVHDRVQQAAYALLSPEHQAALHRRIGEHLLARTEDPEASDELFEIADHLNAGRALLDSDPARTELCSIDVAAGRRAKASAAFGPALSYFRVATDLLPDDPFDAAYEAALEIHVERGELEFLEGDEEASERFLAGVLGNARTPLDAARAYGVRITSLNARGRFGDAIGVGREALARLGVTLPSTPDEIQAETGRELGRIEAYLAEHAIGDLGSLPRMTDPTLEEAMRLLVLLTSSAYIGNPALYPLVVAKQIRLCIDHGNADCSPVAYSSYAVLTSPGGIEAVDTSHAFGELALSMLTDEFAAGNHVNINFVFGTFVHHWRNHVAGGLPYLRQATFLALEAGDFEYVVYASTFEAFYTILQWNDLEATRAALDARAEMLRRSRLEPSARAFWLARQVVANLEGMSDDPLVLTGPEFDEETARASWEQHGDYLSLSALHIWKLFLCYLHGDVEQAMAEVEECRTYIVANTGMLLLAEHNFLHSLVLAQHTLDAPAGREAAVRQIRENQTALERWAGHCPENFAHKALLVEAELSALSDDAGFEETISRYEAAAEAAHAHGFRLHVGLANERAARYCLRRGLPRFARSFLADAAYAYATFGAAPKAEALRAEHGDLLPASARSPASLSPEAGAAGAGVDLESFLKAGQAISGAIQMDALLTELMEILIQNAGAGGGALIRPDGPGLRIVARSSGPGEPVLLDPVPLEEDPTVPAGIVQYAARTGERVVLDDAASEGPFTEEPTVARRALRSVLCLPLRHQGRVRGIVYLENPLTIAAFTPAHTGVLGLLSSQIAIAIENADLYANLEGEVRARTRELEEKNELIRAVFGRYVSDDVAQNVLQSPDGLSLGGVRCRVTVMMADLRGFTALATALPPERVVRLLNNYLSVMTDVILAHDGTIDEFIGDAILAIFGAPLGRPDDAERAVRCALEMQRSMAVVNDRGRGLELPDVVMGIGLATGDVIAGNVGSERRAKYGVVGPTVNLAGRIESYTVGGQILASEETVAAVGPDVDVAARTTVQPKGVPGPISLCDVVGIDGDPGGRLPPRTADLVDLTPALDVRVAILDGKDVREDERPARLVRSSPTEAEIEGAGPIEPLSDLRLRFDPDRVGPMSPFAYAKVLATASGREGCLRVHLTSVPEEVRSLLPG